MISLKDVFYEHSQSLVGICRDVGTNSSRTLTLDLTKFDRAGDGDEDEETSIARGQKRTRSSSTGGSRKRDSSSSMARQ